MNRILNGNVAVGQICASGSGACVAASTPVSGAIYYFAPASTPSAGSVTLTAASHADPSRNASATIFLLGPPGGVSIAVSPAYAIASKQSTTGLPHDLVQAEKQKRLPETESRSNLAGCDP